VKARDVGSASPHESIGKERLASDERRTYASVAAKRAGVECSGLDVDDRPTTERDHARRVLRPA